jgi:hypothetical protein
MVPFPALGLGPPFFPSQLEMGLILNLFLFYTKGRFQDFDLISNSEGSKAFGGQ